ncbi:MAG: alpha/beta fold hydrolase [Planctomycetes bacterium]|nr:alpha/beta fold hydrolase [Planctomycetota bacterium]
MEVWYKSSGKSDGSAVIFLHGLFASSKNWQSVVKRTDHSFRLLNVDLPNHGNSPHIADVSYAKAMTALDWLYEKENLSQATLVGHSMGGKLAMLYALNKGHRVTSLIIEDIAPRPYEVRFSHILQAMKDLDLSACTKRKEVDDLMKEYIPDAIMRMFVMTNLVYREGAYRWRINVPALYGSASHLVGFPCEEGSYEGPALFINGENSDYISKGDDAVVRRFFPQAHIKTISDVGHWVHAEAHEEFSALLNEFLRNPMAWPN